jgi:hypothetical protein
MECQFFRIPIVEGASESDLLGRKVGEAKLNPPVSRGFGGGRHGFDSWVYPESPPPESASPELPKNTPDLLFEARIELSCR